MGYYIRVLGTSDPDIHIDKLSSGLAADGLSAKFLLDESESPEAWSLLLVQHIDGTALMEIERNPVVKGELGKDELEEFRDEISDCEPESAVKWLMKYFEHVKVIYAFRLLAASFGDENFSVVTSIRTTIWNEVGGILQADKEGFSNEDGYHILWQFDDDVTGEWNMAVRMFFGKWVTFMMDLGNPDHRKSFKEGKVPKTSVKF